MKHENNIIWVDKYREGIDNCPMCRKIANWIDCEPPIKVICSNCGFTKSVKEYKLVIDNYGYRIVYEEKQ